MTQINADCTALRQSLNMEEAPIFEPEPFRRYRGLGPDYRCYPPVEAFDETFRERDFRRYACRSNEELIPRRLALAIRVPAVREGDPGRVSAAYLERLLREIERTASLMDRDREVARLHITGLAPGLLDMKQIERLLRSLHRQFHFCAKYERSFGLELEPAGLRREEIGRLAKEGFSEATFRVSRDGIAAGGMSPYGLSGCIEAARAAGMGSIGVSLAVSPAKRSAASLDAWLDALCRCRPDCVELTDMDDRGSDPKEIETAIGHLLACTYRHIGMGWFAADGSPLAACRSRKRLRWGLFGYSLGEDLDVMGFGPGAISHLAEGYCQSHPTLADWSQRIDVTGLSIWRGSAPGPDDIVREEIIRSVVSCGRVDIPAIEKRFSLDFAEYFADAVGRLHKLRADGLVRLEPEGLRVTSRGWYALRIIASCFDRYLQRYPTEVTTAPGSCVD